MATTTLESRIRHVSDTAVIDLYGDINGLADEALSAAYDKADRANPSNIVLNFSDVHYINSTGIALVVGLLARARQAHRRLLVYGLSDHYREIFNITRLSDFMEIHPDETSALAGATDGAA